MGLRLLAVGSPPREVKHQLLEGLLTSWQEPLNDPRVAGSFRFRLLV